VSISNVLSPSSLVSRIAGKSPLAAAACGAGSFVNTLLHALQQAGSAAVSTASGAGALAASAALTGSSAVHGPHGHHGAGPAGPRIGRLLNATA
jgi:hypothetical protein